MRLRRARPVALGLLVLGLLTPPAARAGEGDLPEAKPVRVEIADGMRLAGTFWPARAAHGAGVVLLHDFRRDRSAWDRVLPALRVRDVAVLVVDARGHGESAKQGDVDLSLAVRKRDPKVFAAMHEDAIAAVRWLAKEGGCDPRRIALVGAGLGGSVAVDAARRHPDLVAAVLEMTPSARSLGLDTLANVKGLPAETPLLLLAHRADLALGASELVAARPATRLVVYDDKAPAQVVDEPTWARGTEMFAGIPLVEQTVASFVAAKTGSKVENVVLDGVVTPDGPDADPWPEAIDVGQPGGDGRAWAFRVGHRVLFGGTAHAGVHGLRFEVQTGDHQEKSADDEDQPGLALGPGQVVGFDLDTGRVLWSWGGMGSVPGFPGMDTSKLFGKTYPVVRVTHDEAGTSFEGEWYVPSFGSSEGAMDLRLLVRFDRTAHPGPRGGMMEFDPVHAVDVPSR